MFDFETIIAVVNSIALAAYFLLVGSGLSAMGRRVFLKRVAKLPVGVMLKRAIALYLGLALFGGTILAVRVAGVMFDPNSFERLLFVLVTLFCLLVPLAYFTKVEVFDLDDPHKD